MVSFRITRYTLVGLLLMCTVAAAQDENITVRFSLWHHENYFASDYVSGSQQPRLLQIVESVLDVLCTETDFRITDSGEVDGTDYCESLRTYSGNFEFSSVLSEKEHVDVADKLWNNLTWTEWSVSFVVTQIGPVYLQNSPRQVALQLIQNASSRAVHESIQNGTFDMLIGNGLKASEPGAEVVTFDPNSQLPDTENEVDQYNDEKEAAKHDPIDPEPFHGLRIAGIIMFVGNVLAVGMLTWLGSKRKNKLIVEDEIERKGQGILASDEDLDVILEEGRKSCQLSILKDSDEQCLDSHQSSTVEEDDVKSSDESFYTPSSSVSRTPSTMQSSSTDAKPDRETKN